jgi:hypothetical protein
MGRESITKSETVKTLVKPRGPRDPEWGEGGPVRAWVQPRQHDAVGLFGSLHPAELGWPDARQPCLVGCWCRRARLHGNTRMDRLCRARLAGRRD